MKARHYRDVRAARVLAARVRREIADRMAAEQGNMCALCGYPFSFTRPPTIDHVRAVVNGGSNRRYNLQAAHGECNAAKGCLSMSQFTRRVAAGVLRLPEPPAAE